MKETDPASGVKERGRARRVDEEGEGGEGVAALLGEGRGAALSRRGRGATLKGESEGGGAVYCVHERVFGGAAAGGLGFGLFCACIYFFLCVFKEPTE